MPSLTLSDLPTARCLAAIVILRHAARVMERLATLRALARRPIGRSVAR